MQERKDRGARTYKKVAFAAAVVLAAMVGGESAYAGNHLSNVLCYETGLLKIPDLGIEVKVRNTTSEGGEVSQSVADDPAYAAMIDYSGDYDCVCQPLIADHKTQEFASLPEAVPGETVAILETEQEVFRFLCAKKFLGRNTGEDITYENGNLVYFENEAGVAMYTCNEDWRHITITEWVPISEEEAAFRTFSSYVMDLVDEEGG